MPLLRRRGKYDLLAGSQPSLFSKPLITSTPIKPPNHHHSHNQRTPNTSAIVSPNTHQYHMDLFNSTSISSSSTTSNSSLLMSSSSLLTLASPQYKTHHLPSFRYTPAHFDSVCPYNSALQSDDMCTSGSSSGEPCCSPLPSTSSDTSSPDEEMQTATRCLLDSFVNSQEWTMSRAVTELKLGVVGTVNSGKSTLVHRYLTGSYLNEESPEGGRFKKEVVIDGQSFLLLIRDEGGVPEQQFVHWVDAVIFVFSVDNEQSFAAVWSFYQRMAHYRNTADVPIILVGTQDAISEPNRGLRVIDEARARKLAHDLRRCSYYETCATYGLNVERVFRDACQRILHQRQQSLSSVTAPAPPVQQRVASMGSPAHNARISPSQSMHMQQSITQPYNGRSYSFVQGSQSITPMRQSQPAITHNDVEALLLHQQSSQHQAHNHLAQQSSQPAYPTGTTGRVRSAVDPTSMSYHHATAPQPFPISHNDIGSRQSDVYSDQTPACSTAKDQLLVTGSGSNSTGKGKDDTTPASTPNATRKNRRISNIFNRPGHNKDKDKTDSTSADLHNIEVGSGRAIPVKQGHLYKRSSKALNKEWKKKYVCLYADGRLVYHASLKDYMENVGAKQLYLGLATVKLANQRRPRGARASTQPITVVQGQAAGQSPLGNDDKDSSFTGQSVLNADGQLVTAYEFIQELGPPNNENQQPGSDDQTGSTGTARSDALPNSALNSVQKKKGKHGGHKRMGSGAKMGSQGDDGEDDCEFVIVTNDQRQWHMEAASVEERDAWMEAIEQQMEACIHSQLSNQNKARPAGDRAFVQALQQLPGNDRCADCGANKPVWASMNRGALICIECSGVHRQLGSHITRVRSLELDEWPVECIAVMQALGGNDRVNAIYEFKTGNQAKPTAGASRDEKETWIRAKYAQLTFLRPLGSSVGITQQLVDAVLAREIATLAHVLAHCSDDQVNCTLSGRDRRTPLHLACSIGCPDVTQLLLWFNADMSCVDQEGRSALWYAQQGGSRACADLLVHSGLDKDFGVPPSNPPQPLMPVHNNNTSRLLNGSASSCASTVSNNNNNNNNINSSNNNNNSTSNNNNAEDNRQSMVKLQASVI